VKTPAIYHDYAKFTALPVTLRDDSFEVISKPGLPHWNSLLPSEELLADALWHAPHSPPEAARVLLLGCRHGALAVHLARHLSSSAICYLADSNNLALECTRRSLAHNHLAIPPILPSLAFSHPLAAQQTGLANPPAQQLFDMILMLPPRGRILSRAWLALAFERLDRNGKLYLAGANDEGIQATIQDAAALFGACTTLSYRKGSRVALAIRNEIAPPPPWLDLPGVRPGTFHAQEILLEHGERMHIHSLPGIFSYEHLDPGSALLLAHSPRFLAGLPADARIVDAGCGYGILGMAVARQMPAAQVSLVDIDLAAILCTRLNLHLNAIVNAEAFPSDLLDACANQRYHLILSNPPFHAGKQVRYDMSQALIAQAQALLCPGGALVLVANRFIRYEKIMNTYFDHVETLAETGQFHLLRASNRVRSKKLK
jgi:16S rRNA (guanine1207-N2)-methyltransferase